MHNIEIAALSPDKALSRRSTLSPAAERHFALVLRVALRRHLSQLPLLLELLRRRMQTTLSTICESLGGLR